MYLYICYLDQTAGVKYKVGDIGQGSLVSSYGGVIRRTGTGEDPDAPTTGATPTFVELLLQPTMLSTWTWISPGWAPPWTSSMNACKYPSIVTFPPVAGIGPVVSTIGIVTMELLVVTK